MYIQRAEAYIDELHERGTVCPKCGESDWALGCPLGTLTGCVKFWIQQKSTPQGALLLS